MRVKFNDLHIGTRQRKDYGRAEMEELQRDMGENGQITAITVRPAREDEGETDPDYSGQPWVLVAGGRRCIAAIALGWLDIEGFAREELSDLTHRILELHENLKRKAMTWQEEVDSKAEIARLRRLENPGITDGEIAKELGESGATFSRDLQTAAFLEKNPGLRSASSKHSARNAGKILEAGEVRERLAAEGPPKALAELVGSLEERVRTADAVEYVVGLPEDSIDLALLDGPYGYNYWKLGSRESGESLSRYDDRPEAVGLLYEELLPHLKRVVRPTGWLVFFCGMETYDLLRDLMKSLELLPEPYPWIWYRPNSRRQPRYPHLHAQNQAELLLVTNMGQAFLSKPSGSVLMFDNEYGPSRTHVNQKPQALLEELIQRFTFTGDTVLDCFFGSGSGLAAAASQGRVPYGCDSNPHMLSLALTRIRASQRIITREEIEASRKRFQQRLAEPTPSTPVEEPTEWLQERIQVQVLAEKGDSE